MKSKIFTKRLIIQIIIVIVLDGLFFGLVNPNKVNSLFLIAGFVLLGLTLYVILQIAFKFLIKLGFNIKNRRKLSIFVSVIICLLLALQSIGQLSARDVLIMVPIGVLLYIYVAYIRPRTLV